MGTIANKLEYLNDTKEIFKNKLNSIGAEIDNSTKFRDYINILDGIYDKANTASEYELEGDTEQTTYSGIQLFDIDGTVESGTLVKYNNGLKLTGNLVNEMVKFDLPEELSPSTDYTIKLDIVKNTLQVDPTLRVTLYDSTLGSEVSVTEFTASGSQTISLWRDSCDKISFSISAPEEEGAEMIIDNIILVKGTPSSITYEPYVGGKASPNPDYPQNIEVVTGRQEVSVLGKNLYNGEYKNGSYNEVTGNIEKNNNAYCNKNPIRVQPNSNYIFSINGVARTETGRYLFYDKNNSYLSSVVTTNSFTTPNNCYYINWHSTQLKTNYPNGLSNIQIEEGLQATDYEEYKRQIYEINLGKNLFDKDNANILSGTLTSSALASNNSEKTLYIPCEPNTTYALSKVISGRFRVATTSTIPVLGQSIDNRVLGGNTSIIYTTSNNSKYLLLNYYVNTDTLTEQQILDSIQIEVGDKATTYSAYKTPIELCKIGNYKDRIYQDNGTWYIEKNIGKVVFDGSEQWAQYGGNNNGFLVYGNSSSPFYNKVGNYGGYCNYFVVENSYTTWTGTGKCGFNSASVFWLIHTDTSINTTDKFKTWLQAHNTIVYYVLATPTTNEITDSELINQLEAVKDYLFDYYLDEQFLLDYSDPEVIIK